MHSPFFARILLECISLGDVKRARSTSFGNCQYLCKPKNLKTLKVMTNKPISMSDVNNLNTRSSAPSSGSVLKLSALVVHDHHTYSLH